MTEFKKKDDVEIRQREIVPNEDVQRAASSEEPMFLSLLMKHKDLLHDVMSNSVIETDHFLLIQHKRLFALIAVNYVKKNSSLLTEAAMEEYAKEADDPAASRQFFDKIYNLVVSKDDYERLKTNILNRYTQQKFYEICWLGDNGEEGLVNKILNAKDDQIQLVSTLQDRLVELSAQNKKDGFTRIASLSQTLNAVMSDIDDRRKNPKKHYGFMTGFKGIDDVIFGFKKGRYAIIVGYPNGGKTTMLINLALGMSLRGARVCYVTVESDENEITERMLCNQANISSKILKAGGEAIKPEYYESLMRAKEHLDEKIGGKFVLINVTQGTKVSDLLSLIDAKRRAVGFDVVFIDYLDVISSITKYPSRPDLEIGEVSVMLQAYGKKYDLVTITAQSFNNEMIKAIKKQLTKVKDHEGVDSQDVEEIVGIEGVGGTQKLSRDADYIWGLILGNHDQHLAVFWMKSRFSGKPKPFILAANLDACKLVDLEEYTVTREKEPPESSDDAVKAYKDKENLKEKVQQEQLERLRGEKKVEENSNTPPSQPVQATDEDAKKSIERRGEKGLGKKEEKTSDDYENMGFANNDSK